MKPWGPRYFKGQDPLNLRLSNPLGYDFASESTSNNALSDDRASVKF